MAWGLWCTALPGLKQQAVARVGADHVRQKLVSLHLTWFAYMSTIVLVSGANARLGTDEKIIEFAPKEEEENNARMIYSNHGFSVAIGAM